MTHRIWVEMETRRRYWTRCSCGWEAASDTVAEADRHADQHAAGIHLARVTPREPQESPGAP